LISESSPTYHGWIIVALSFAVFTASYSLLYGYAAFLPSLTEDLSISKAEAIAPYSACIFVYSVASLWSGRLTDRLGARPIVFAGGILVILGFVVLSRAEDAAMLFLGFTLLYGVGMSGVFIPTSAAIVKWFLVKRGLAVGIANLGGSGAMAVGPLAAAMLISEFGWRTSFVLLGIVGGGLVSLAALGFRPAPSNVSQIDAGQDTEKAWTLPEARRTSTFWIFCVVYLVTLAVMFFPLAHFAAFAIDLGWGPNGGGALFLLAAIGGVMGRLGIGWLADRFGAKVGLFGLLACMAVSCAAFGVTTDALIIHASAAVFGVGAGSAVALYPVVVSALFGRAHVGAIAGFAFAFTCSGGGLGPLIGGWIRDETGSYDGAFLFAAAASVFALICAMALRPPK
jgi:MFS family permease